MTTTPERGVEEKSDCELYDHIPVPYGVAFWHCKVCCKELFFATMESLESHHQQLQRDRASLHTSLVAAVEGKKAERFKWDYKEGDGEYKDGYNQALDQVLTIINSIFKE